MRVHGTTKQSPLQRFQAEEQAQLHPLPAMPYDLAQWKRVRLHRDGYIVFEQAFYSAPFRFIGQPMWVRGSSQEVRLYTADYALIATHARAQPGERRTHPDHLPPQKVPGALWTMEQCLALAQEVGPATLHFIQAILGDPIVDRHPRAVRVLRLRSRVGDARLEAACTRAVHFGDLSYATLKRILELGLETQPLPPGDPPATPKSGWAFMRSATDLLGHVVAAMGGKTWN